MNITMTGGYDSTDTGSDSDNAFLEYARRLPYTIVFDLTEERVVSNPGYGRFKMYMIPTRGEGIPS
jgi:hypothetical protein